MKKIILAVAVTAVASMAIASSVSAGSKPASAGVERYQTQSMTITAVQPEGAVGQWGNVWTHTYNVTLNPCDGSFSGTGSVSGTQNGFYSNETISGHLNGNTVSFSASRPDGVEYSLANAPLDNSTVTLATSNPVAPWDLEFKVSKTMGAQSSYKSHGEYVSLGGVDDAAHRASGRRKAARATMWWAPSCTTTERTGGRTSPSQDGTAARRRPTREGRSTPTSPVTTLPRQRA